MIAKAVESWIVEARRKVCGGCADKLSCVSSGVIHRSLFAEVSECPSKLHLTRIESITARAWPEGVEPSSGCCDRMG